MVEDDAAVRRTMVELLTLWAYHVLEAANGSEALALLLEQHVQVDLIVSDVVMPQVGGVMLFKRLAAAGVTIPVILLTGHPLSEELEGLRSRGLYAWLSKPPEIRQMAFTVAAALKGAPLPHSDEFSLAQGMD